MHSRSWCIRGAPRNRPYVTRINTPFLCGSSLTFTSDFTTVRNHSAVTFVTKCLLKSCNVVAHKRIHSGVKPYTYHVCNKAFRQICQLTRQHIHTDDNVHAGVRLYTYDICDEAFDDDSSLVKLSCVDRYRLCRGMLYMCIFIIDYTVSQKKLCKLIFCHNFAKFRRIVKIFGKKIAERIGFSEVYSFSTSPNLCQHTTV